jgi:two-component system chemotaxis response regulator CheB
MYIAPPDYHMIVEDGRLRMVQGPRENRHRPAIDPLFRSAAMAYGPRVIGVILSGLLDDGTAGLMVVHAAGGKAIVQEPRTALFASMPTSALRQVPEAVAVPLREIADLLLKLSREEVPDTTPRGAAVVAEQKEIKLAEADMPEIENDGRRGKPSQFACPDCGGVLWEIDDTGFLLFRCRVGHAFTAAHLDAEQHRAVEAALWAALRALEERASLYRNMAERVRSAQLGALQKEYEASAREQEAQANTLRDFLLDLNSDKGSLRPLTRAA